MIDLLLLWHMHQPRYAHPDNGINILPWVRLHACSGYLDMARVLEKHPTIRVTVNFVPSLVEQVQSLGAGERDALELLTERPTSSLDEKERDIVVARCFSVHASAIAARPRYAELAARNPGDRWTDAEIRDLECLFLFGWLGFAARHYEPAIVQLEAKGRDFSETDKRDAHALVHAAIARVLPAWRALSARGQVELAASPFYHPIIPLLADTDVATRARPNIPIPPRFSWPADAHLQIERGRAAHAAWTGEPPRGMWPPEGSLSPEAVALYASSGILWLTGDEETLARSLEPPVPRTPHTQIWRHEGVSLLFRDRDLSDRIGFRYANMPADHAVEDLLAGARNLAGPDNGIACVFLDGENAWEHYPGRGEPFLDRLYTRLEEEEQRGEIRTRTISQAIAERGPGTPLERLHSGSWIAGDFHIWIGDPAKNRGWTLLGHARERLAVAERERPEGDAGVNAARDFLLVAEGSDWFWWFGEPNNSAEDALYDELFRAYLAAAYRALGETPPAELEHPIDPDRTRKIGAFSVMRPGTG